MPAEFLAMVALVIVSVPALPIAPPTVPAELLERVVSRIVPSPRPRCKMPPPVPALLDAKRDDVERHRPGVVDGSAGSGRGVVDSTSRG